eukprot:368132_1
MSVQKDTEQKPDTNNDTNEQPKSSPKVKTLQQLDEIIGEYYINMDKANDYYNDIHNQQDGKFQRFVDENQFEDEDLADEFDNDDDVTNCSYLDFDDNNTFPFDETIENDSDRPQKLYFFLKYCYLYGKHPTILNDPHKIILEEMKSTNTGIFVGGAAVGACVGGASIGAAVGTFVGGSTAPISKNVTKSENYQADGLKQLLSEIVVY